MVVLLISSLVSGQFIGLDRWWLLCQTCLSTVAMFSSILYVLSWTEKSAFILNWRSALVIIPEYFIYIWCEFVLCSVTVFSECVIFVPRFGVLFQDPWLFRRRIEELTPQNWIIKCSSIVMRNYYVSRFNIWSRFVDMARIQIPVFICGFVSREIDMMSLLPLYHGFGLHLRKFACPV
jgi:hypothetical protein